MSSATTAPTRRLTVLADDGARLAVWVHEPVSAPRETTPTLVLAHGWALSHESWTPVLPLLLDAAPVRVVTYDQRMAAAGHTLGMMIEAPK